MSDHYADDKIHCPRCGVTGCISYAVRNSPALTWTDESGISNTHYLGAVRDYLCRNCSTEFLIQEVEP